MRTKVLILDGILVGYSGSLHTPFHDTNPPREVPILVQGTALMKNKQNFRGDHEYTGGILKSKSKELEVFYRQCLGLSSLCHI